MAELTLGEKIVRSGFNPGNNDKVQNLKEKFAHLINDIDKLRQEGFDARLCAMAITNLEIAAMVGVKAATSEKNQQNG